MSSIKRPDSARIERPSALIIAGRDGLLKSVRTADRHRDLTDTNLGRVRKTHMVQIRRIDSNHAEIGMRIGPDQLRGKNSRIVQRYLQLPCAVHDVTIREDETIARDDETGTAARPAIATNDSNVSHTRRDAIHHRGDRLANSHRADRHPIAR